MRGQLAVVEAWLAAVDRADAGAVMALSALDPEAVGPRGSVRGRGCWRRGWRGRAAPPGRAVVASRFVVDGGVVTRYQRHDDGLPAALAAAGLRTSDEVAARAG